MNTLAMAGLITIILDVDGILVDFNRKFTEWSKANNIEGIQQNAYTWDFGWQGTPQELLALIHKFIATNPQLDILDPEWLNFKHFIKNLEKLFDVHVNVYVVTSYSNEPHRIEMLKQMNIPYDGILFPSGKNKVGVMKSLNPTIIVEDCPEHIDNIHRQIPTAKVYAPNIWNYLAQYEGKTDIVTLYQNAKQLFAFITYDIMNSLFINKN